MHEFAIPQDEKPKAKDPIWIHRQTLFGKAPNRRERTTFNQWNASERKKRNAATKLAADRAEAQRVGISLTDYQYIRLCEENGRLQRLKAKPPRMADFLWRCEQR